MDLSLSQLIEACGATEADVVGEVPTDLRITGFSWDSRTIESGWLYVALPGERVDGHDFVRAAVDAGAVALLVSRDVSAELGTACPAAILLVDDTAYALSQLAAYWRRHLNGTVIGLTGSTGKTTTKNLVRDVLAAAGSVVATEANQNNELGVPRTLLSADSDTDFTVVEMGMRGSGQIAELCAIAHPDWGLVTNVGESHIELLGSRDAIAQAKAELLGELPAERGIAFVNAADEYAAELCRYAQLSERGVTVVFFDGTGERRNDIDGISVGIPADRSPFVWATDIGLDGQGCPAFTINVSGFEVLGSTEANGSLPCTLALRGFHNVSNACSAVAVGLAAGLSLSECVGVLAQSQPEQGRQQVHVTDGGITVIDDSYNANPDSMCASLSTFAAMQVKGKRVAVLGDMLELGDFSRECHERVGAVVAQSKIDRLVCVGELSGFIARAAIEGGLDPSAVSRHETADSVMAALRPELLPGDAVLVKASHSIGLERVVKELVG